MSAEIVRYRPELKEAVVALQTGLWGPDRATNAAYLEWKYERNPYLPGGLIHLALSEGRVIAMRGLYGARWEAGCPREEILAPCAGDTVVVPEHRRGPVLARLMQAAADDLAARGVRYAVNLSANLAMQLASLIDGWRSLGPLEVATRQPGERPSWWSRVRKQGALAVLDARAAHQRGGRVALAHAPRPAEMANLIERLGSDGRIRHVRDADYFAWRFGNPLARYRFLFWEGTALEGYLVLHAHRFKRDVPLTIVDWEATTAEARRDLLAAAIDWAGPSRLRIWATSLDAEARALLEAARFKVYVTPESIGRSFGARASRQTILVRATRADDAGQWVVGGRRLLDLRDWDVRGLASDMF